MEKKEAVSVKNAQKYYANLNLIANLVFIKSNFQFLP